MAVRRIISTNLTSYLMFFAGTLHVRRIEPDVALTSELAYVWSYHDIA